MTPDEFAVYLEEICINGKFDYESDQTRNSILECIKSGGRREEDYIQVFKQILARIKKGAGFPDNETKGKKDRKQVNVIVDNVKNYNMAVFFEAKKIKTDGKMINRYEIYKIKIVQQKNNKVIKTIFPPAIQK
jgi:hypothetical protein